MNATESGTIGVSVVYLRPGLRFERELVLGAAATVGDAIAASGIRSQLAEELAGAALEVGVFGQRRTLGDRLHDGDRVEVYRPLSIGPKEARRIRAAVGRRRKAAKVARAR